MNYSKWSFAGGCHIPGHKEPVASQALLCAALPDKVYISMSQHVGAPARPLVGKDEKVKTGQLIAEAVGFVSANIHASVSGTVLGMEKRVLADGRWSDCIVIKSDGLDTLDKSIKNEGVFDEAITGPGIIEKIKVNGIVGMGGAAFPTHIKYLPNKDYKAECVILNGIECEPYISDDYRVMIDCADKTIRGLRYFLRAAGCRAGYIAIGDNKKDAYEVLRKKAEPYPEIKTVLCKEKFPQGSEKHLIYSVAGREVPTGGLPIQIGAIVNNIGTAVMAADAVERNMPLFERLVTVNGNGVEKPGNYLVRIGSLYSDLVKSAGGMKADVLKIINGGPMMGFAVPSADLPIIKNTTALLLLTAQDLPEYIRESHCVRCARCLDACPMRLEPTRMVHAVKRRDWETLKEENLLSCIECGSCAYVCPARIPLVQYFRLGKQYLNNNGQGARNSDFAENGASK